MPEISATAVKELRDISGAGMMDCKNALSKSAGNLDEAMDTIDTLDYYDSISKSQEFNYKHFRRMLEYHNEKDIKINFIKKELIPKLYNKKKDYRKWR